MDKSSYQIKKLLHLITISQLDAAAFHLLFLIYYTAFNAAS